MSRRSPQEKSSAGKGSGRRPEWAALAAFAVIVIATPLAFGGVDRVVQLCLLAVFAVAVLLRPPARVSVDRWANALLLTLLGILLVKEFAPAEWFGSVPWRAGLANSYGVQFPWTHHPEPGRAVDALLTAGMAFLWLLWVRTLAAHRENQPWLAWALFLSAGIVAAVSFATKGIDARAIYGLRYTQGWQGFGPFPNRNHTACFLAMGALIGCGCLVWAARRRNWPLLGVGAFVFIVVFGALLATQSRGGLLAFCAGLTLYSALALAKLRSRQAAAGLLAGGLVFAAFAFAFGGQLIERFSSMSGSVSNVSRVLIWKDALALWRDAPLFGHGAGSFASIFPLRQTLPLDNQIILHPESSWILWLVELGAIVTVLAVILFGRALWPHARSLFQRHDSFFLLAAAWAAAAALLAHSAIDVPAHRWGTMLIALAAIAIACPADRVTELTAGTRKAALVPLAVGTFWLWPFVHDTPAWSPSTLARLLTRSQTSTVSEPDLRRALAWFPLNGKVHQLLGAHLLHSRGGLSDEWTPRLQAALRLNPGSWAAPITLARICRQAAPAHALSYWQTALERSGWRREELFGRALVETSGIPDSAGTWANYVETHPELLLIYANAQPGESGKPYLKQWWRSRAHVKKLTRAEVTAFYELAARWPSMDQIEGWMQLQPERKADDFRRWAGLLHSVGQSDRAWKLLNEAIPEPPFPAALPNASLAVLENYWHLSPENLLNAQAFAHALFITGQHDKAAAILVEVGRRENSPRWFREKAAHMLARKGQLDDAISMLVSPQAG